MERGGSQMAVTDQLTLDDKARHESALTLPAPLNSAASVPLAFAVGWQMTELFALTTRGPTSRTASAAHRLEGLPGLIAVDTAGQWDLLVQQVRTKVAHLTDAYLRTGMNVSKLQAFDKEMEALVGHPPAAAQPRGNGAGASDPAIAALVEASACLRIALATAHSRLGRAYGLGVGLAEICRQRGKATESAADFERRFLSGTRSAQDALADLASSFPAHTSRAVSLSLAQWMEWAQDPRLSGERVRWPNEAVALALGHGSIEQQFVFAPTTEPGVKVQVNEIGGRHGIGRLAAGIELLTVDLVPEHAAVVVDGQRRGQAGGIVCGPEPGIRSRERRDNAHEQGAGAGVTAAVGRAVAAGGEQQD